VKKTQKPGKHYVSLVVKILLRVLLSIILLIVLAIALIQIPAIQNKIKQRFVRNLADKWKTRVNVGYISLNLWGDIIIRDIFIGDQQQDTLLNVGKIKVGIDVRSLFRKELLLNSISISQVDFVYQVIDTAGRTNIDFITKSPTDTVQQENTAKNEEGGWAIRFKNIELENIRLRNENKADSSAMNINLGHLALTLTESDLKKMQFGINTLSVSETRVIQTSYSRIEKTKPDTAVAKPLDLTVTLKEVNFKDVRYINNTRNSKLSAKLGQAHFANGNFNALNKRVSLGKMGIEQSAIELIQSGKGTEPIATAETTSPEEKEWNISADDIQLGFNTVVVQNKTSPKGPLGTISLKDIIVHLSATFEGAQHWQGNLSRLQFTDALTNQQTSLKTEVVMQNGRIKANPLQFTTGKSYINAHGEFTMMSNKSKSLIPDFKLTVLSSNIRQSDFVAYLTDSMRRSLAQLPKEIRYAGNTVSSHQKLHTDGTVNTSEGNLQVKAEADLASGIKNGSYNVHLAVQNLQAGHLMNDTTLGAITGTVNVEGSGSSLKNLNTKTNIDIKSVGYNKYVYKNITLDGSIANKQVELTAKTDDPMLNSSFHINGYVGDTVDVYVSTNASYIDAKTLGLTEDSIAVAANMKTHFIMLDKRNLEISSDTSRLTVLMPDKKITTENKLLYKVKGDTVQANVNTSFADISYNGSLPLQEIPALLKNYFSNYFTTTDTTHTIKDYFDASVKFKDISILNALTQSKIDISEDANIKASFRDNHLKANFDIEELSYNDMMASDLKILAEGRDSSFQVNVNLGSVSNKTIELTDISLASNLNNGQLENRFSFSNSEGDKWFDIGMTMEPQNPAKNMHVIKPLLLNYKEWEADANNLVAFTPDGINLKNLTFKREDKGIALQTEPNNKHALSLELKNLNLSFLSEILRGDSTAFAGKINGKATVFNLFDKQAPVFAVNMNVDSISAGQQTFGNLNIKASNEQNSNVAKVDVTFGKDEALFNLQGEYGLKEELPMDLRFTARDFNIASVQPFISDILSNASGIVNASIRIQGKTDAPKLNGQLTFDKTSMFIAPAKTSFALDKQHINFDGDRIRFPNFTVEDADGNPLVINGEVLFSNLKNIRTDLNLTTNGFLAYQGNQSGIPGEENRVILTSNMQIKGGTSNPTVRANIQIVEDSKFFYKIMRGATNLSEEGVIVFVGAENHKDQDETESSAAIMENLNLTANIRMADNTAITLITDPARNIGLHMKAGGVFSMVQRPHQAPRLTGRLNVSGGDYTVDFSGIKRKLQISDSSSIVWYGDIAKPELNLRVVYQVRASPAELLGEQQTGDKSTPEDKSTLPFLVNMNITGALASPNLSFYLSLPREYEGIKNGLVAAKLKEINYNESDVNQKAMALLLFGRFDFSNLSGILSSNSGGTNTLISNALNQFAAQKLKFIDLHFDLESYNNYGEQTSENQRTELLVAASRKFVDNRLNVQLGTTFVLQGDEREQQRSWVEKVSPVFNVSYMLNKSRSLSVAAFRRSEYRGLIEGKVVSTGAGIIYQKDFDTLKELFQRVTVNQGTLTNIQKDEE
jgi:hypothetical protein